MGAARAECRLKRLYGRRDRAIIRLPCLRMIPLILGLITRPTAAPSKNIIMRGFSPFAPHLRLTTLFSGAPFSSHPPAPLPSEKPGALPKLPRRHALIPKRGIKPGTLSGEGGETKKCLRDNSMKRSQNTAPTQRRTYAYIIYVPRAYNIWYHTVRQHSTVAAEATNGGHSKQLPPNQRGEP